MIKLNNTQVLILKMNKKGELQNAYSPLLNLIDKHELLGDFTTSNLNFNKNIPVDILVTDEYDGSLNLIINDDINNPKLINSRFSVQENNTFNIPVHYGNTVNNIYDDDFLNRDLLLLKLYNKIPTLTFTGLSNGGLFQCGSYVFYFKFSDSDGNLTNIVQESGIIQIHIGTVNSVKVRMGMQNENSEKCIGFKLSDIDADFDYVRVYYEKASTDDSQAIVKNYFMIDLNFPIKNTKCEITLTGGEKTILITQTDLQTEFADIASAKTHVINQNTLFLGNVSSTEHDYKLLQEISWKIRVTAEQNKDNVGEINLENYSLLKLGYYNLKNVYNEVGYWGDEYYRLGVVYIFNNNQLSPVFNITGYDLSKNVDWDKYVFQSDGYKRKGEPDDYFFDKFNFINSKGVIKINKQSNYTVINNILTFKPIKLKFDLSQIIYKRRLPKDDTERSKWTNVELEDCIIDKKRSETPQSFELLKKLNIKGLFFVRQKRIPTIISLGLVIGLTGKNNGCIPVLKNDESYITKSFLDQHRLLTQNGSTVKITSKVSNKALLIPDYDINEATLNLIFTGSEFQLTRIASTRNRVFDYHQCINTLYKDTSNFSVNNVKLTAIPKNTKLKTDGENYFSSLAGNPSEPHKTEDVNNVWNETPPLDLTMSTSLIRGIWGSYVGMSTDKFNYGDIVNIKLNDFKDESHNALEFQKRFNDFSSYSAISHRVNINYFSNYNSEIICARGDCFINPFTHRMMSNFIDPELPTNTKIINPSCWSSNYAVRNTCEILQTTHSNLTDDSEGWYDPPPANVKSAIVSLIFAVFTANIGSIVNFLTDLGTSTNNKKLDKYANEIVESFELHARGTGGMRPDGNSGSTERANDYKKIVSKGWIKKSKPKESGGGFNIKALFKSDQDWDLHGIASINRADVNAVSFGQWITFPICSQYNLALRDIDFNQATEEASLNRKRAFYPFEEMDVTNHLLESNVINGATKISLSSFPHVLFLTVPYLKQEFFNRIYWSKPNIASTYINSYRMLFNSLYHDYNKEFGSITKLMTFGNDLLVVFQHGLGTLTINKTPLSELEMSNYLASKSVLPIEIQSISSDFGSMWKDSVIETQKGFIYGVDTVAKKIWRISGNGLEMISDNKITKFLNDHITLSEYDYNEYLGHINVKTHYNAFKRDVMFTYYRDVPLSKRKYVKLKTGDIIIIYNCESYDPDEGTYGKLNIKVNNKSSEITSSAKIKWNEENLQFEIDRSDDYQNALSLWLSFDEYEPVDISGNLILEDTPDPRVLIEKWEKGETWNLCFNESTNSWVTLYDWTPVESCNVDNIYFSFDKDQLDDVLIDDQSNIYKGEVLKHNSSSNYDINTGVNGDRVLPVKKIASINNEKIANTDKSSNNGEEIKSLITNKVFMDKAFTNNTKVYIIDKSNETYSDIIPLKYKSGQCLTFYYNSDSSEKQSGQDPVISYSLINRISVADDIDYSAEVYKLGKDLNWKWVHYRLDDSRTDKIVYLKLNNCKISEVKIQDEYNSNPKDPVLKYYNLRSSEGNCMYLWKHGQAGLYDNQGKIKPTNWYGKLHEWNFEFIVNETPEILKIFNNLLIISNKAAPYKLEYEVVGEGYEWYIYKPVIEWINTKALEEYLTYGHGVTYTISDKHKFEEDYIPGKNLEDFIKGYYKIVLENNYKTLTDRYSDFPEIFNFENDDKIKKLPYLKMKLVDQNGLYYDPEDDLWRSKNNARAPMSNIDRRTNKLLESIKQGLYSWNTADTCLINDEQLNENKVHTEQLIQDIKKYGRIRGNTEYLEDNWRVEIRPINFKYAYLSGNDFKLTDKKYEMRHRDKFMRVKVRYDGKDLALIQSVSTLFNPSFA